jgi:hypothetical protein
MKHLIAAACLLILASAAFADDAAPQSASVGGGVTHPWSSPYRTALTLPPVHALPHP